MKSLLFLSSLCLTSLLVGATSNPLHIKVSRVPFSSNQSYTPPKSTSRSSNPTKTNHKSTASQNSSIAQKTSTSTQSSSLNLKSLMSPAQQQATGISSLTPSQVSSLESWLSHYVSSEKNQQNTVSGNQVDMVLGEGHYVKLGNGEVWVISPNAWIYTYYWQKGTPITIGKSGDMLFPTLLTNTAMDQAVNAIGATKDISQAFSQSYTITKVGNGGQFLDLSNGSSWQVDPSARFMVQSWTPGTSVFVVKRPSATTGAGYELYNGTTTRTILVNQTKAPKEPRTLLKPSTQATTFPSSQANQATDQQTTFPTQASNDGQNPSQKSKN